MKKLFCCLLSVALLLGGLVGCSAREKKYEKTWFEWFDTFSTLTVYTDSEETFDTYAALCASYLEDYHELLDIYHDYEGIHNLKTVNDRAGETVEIDPRLGDFLRFAQDVDALTQHHTNVGMGRVTALWHQAREAANADPKQAALPDKGALQIALAHTELDRMVLSDDDRTVCLTDPEMALDGGALGKGYVARLIAQALIEKGCDSFLLNLGGNTVAHGEKPGGSPWLVGIESPDKGIAYDSSIRLEGRALVTSGSYQRYFTVDGVRYHHIVDPDSGYPENRFLSVSVLCPDSALADALSTALFSMTEEEGRALLETVEEDVEALWITADGGIRTTDGWSDHVYEGGAS